MWYLDEVHHLSHKSLQTLPDSLNEEVFKKMIKAISLPAQLTFLI